MLHVDDDAFVRAPVDLVYRRLTDIGGWERWWRGVQARPMTDAPGRETWALELVRNRWQGVRLAARPHAYRHEKGFKLTVTGDIDGEVEFWLEVVPGGTVVHHLMTGRATGPERSIQRTYRTVARRGLWCCKDALQTEVRTAVGMTP